MSLRKKKEIKYIFITYSAIKSLQNQVISHVSSGGKHTAVLTKAGNIFICGTDVLGLLGTETKKWKEQHKFQILSSLDFEFITQVACAEFHSLCLTKDGHVYAWGGNLHNVNYFIFKLKFLEIRSTQPSRNSQSNQIFTQQKNNFDFLR